MVKQQQGNNPSVKGRIWPKVRFLCINGERVRWGVKWRKMGRFGERWKEKRNDGWTGSYHRKERHGVGECVAAEWPVTG